MSVFDILTMIGGLALFLYGMEVMGNGLSKASGGRMERILEKMTDNIFKAVLLGAGVTAVIQSSSATTVMVVGFVNSGIMKLSQAVGVIMGANIGTTVTSWLLSLTGIQGDNFILTLMKPSSFSPILAVIGVGFLMFSKNEKKKDIGTIMIGFTVLMFGMETMSDAVKPLADVPEFANILLMFKNPLLGMLAGLVLTAVIQSSSASVGILQSLCVTGAVSYGAAIPIIMGQNIGTCVTALLSSIGASKNAKRTAFVHLYFNIIGTTIFMIGFYALMHLSISVLSTIWPIRQVLRSFTVCLIFSQQLFYFLSTGDLRNWRSLLSEHLMKMRSSLYSLQRKDRICCFCWMIVSLRNRVLPWRIVIPLHLIWPSFPDRHCLLPWSFCRNMMRQRQRMF